jgi:hypothetical protein
MEYAAIVLATLGFAAGLVFRIQVLLVIVALLLVVSVVVSVAQDYSFLKTALLIMAAQSIVQASYFLGLVMRACFCDAQRRRPIL